MIQLNQDIRSLDFQDYRDENGDFTSIVASFCPLVAAGNIEHSVASIDCLLYSIDRINNEKIREIRDELMACVTSYLDSQETS